VAFLIYCRLKYEIGIRSIFIFQKNKITFDSESQKTLINRFVNNSFEKKRKTHNIFSKKRINKVD